MPDSLKVPQRSPLWRQIQTENFRSLEALALFLQLTVEQKGKLLGGSSFPLNVPRRLAEKMEKGTLNDPLLRQFVPLQEETERVAGFVLDPVQDLSFRTEKKLLQKYHGRALLLTTGACVMNCRFCFRRHFPYETEAGGFGKELEQVANDPSCAELILSGGDPLSLGEGALAALFQALEGMAHVKRVRFHSRFPLGIPERIDEPFLEMLSRSSKQIFFVLHVNHPKELDEEIFAALQRMQRRGVVLLSQSVLLKGVNDEATVLLALFEGLINRGVIPYYLHCLDPVEGAAHFAVPDERAKELVRGLQGALSGYGVPRLVREEPGKLSKTDVFH